MSDKKPIIPKNINTTNPPTNPSPATTPRLERRFTLVEVPNSPVAPGFNNSSRTPRKTSPPLPRGAKPDKVFEGKGENTKTLGVSLMMGSIEEEDEGEGVEKEVEESKEKSKARGRDPWGRPPKPGKKGQQEKK